MKKITAVALGIAAAMQAGAVPIQKNDTSMVDLYGRVYAGHVFGESSEGSNPGSEATDGIQSYIRLGVKGSSMVTRDYSIMGRFETQLYLSDTEKPFDTATNSNSSDNNLRTRLAYAGFNTNWGTVTFGRQYGAVTLVSDWTDVALSDLYGGEGLGTGTDKFGTDRGSSILQYTHDWMGFTVKGQYQFRNESSVDSGEDQGSYGLAFSYDIADYGVSLGAAYNKGERPGDSADAKIFVIGAKYEMMGFYSAITWADGSDFASSGQDHDGWELALAYDFGNGWHVAGLYNTLQYDATATVGEYDRVDYITLGAQYDFTKTFSALGEYRINSGKTSPTAEEYKDELNFALKYVF